VRNKICACVAGRNVKMLAGVELDSDRLEDGIHST
jgi:hypothetical protein